MKDKYYSTSLKISIVGIIINLLLSVVKLVAGIIANSISVIIDAFHSFSDLITTLIVMFSITLSAKPPDKLHPFGHGRAEDVGGVVMSIILVMVGLEFLKASLMRLIVPQQLRVTKWIIVLVFVTAIIKLLLGLFTNFFSRRIHSFLLQTDAAHHYSDSFTSFIIALGLIFVERGFPSVDAYLGIFTAAVIILWAVKLAKEFIDNLIGRESPHEFYVQIKNSALSFPRVESVHGINIHSYGRNRIISLHILVDRTLPLEQAHAIADSIEKKLLQQGLGRCVVHVDLKSITCSPHICEVEKVLCRLVKSVPHLENFHSLEVITTEDKNILNFHLILNKNTSLIDSHIISHRIMRFLQRRFKFSRVYIHLEPS